MELEEVIERLGDIKTLLEIDNGANLEITPRQQKLLAQNLGKVLNHLTKQEKMINLMAKAISSYDGQLVINQYKDRNEVKAKFEEYAEDGTYEQYFEKKAEED